MSMPLGSRRAAQGGDGPSASRQPSQLYTLKAIARRCDVSDRSVRRWVANGELSAVRLGRALRISEADFQAFLAVRRTS